VAPDLQNRWHRFLAVCIFCCADTSPKIPEIFPKIPDIPETPGKSPEYPGFINKFVLSGDFKDSPIHPPSSATSRSFQLVSEPGAPIRA
jgi:hypothetical protein